MASLLKVLLVDDDSRISSALGLALRADYDVDISDSGKSALSKSRSKKYDLIILDLNLPDIAGRDVCLQIRHRDLRVPILILSGISNIPTKITLLDCGASDYLTKPFALGELKARLRALSRSIGTGSTVRPRLVMEAFGVVLDKQAHAVSRNGTRISLRPKEFNILVCFMENPGQLVRRQDLIDKVWTEADVWTNTVEVHINHLRDKLDKPFSGALIHTVHGLGYKMAEI